MTHDDRLRLLCRMRDIDVRRNELLADMVELVERELAEFGLTATAATLVAHAIADRLADFWGGQTISFPRDYPWKLAQKELAVYEQFRGDNLAQLTRDTGMTERGLRKMIARIRHKIREQQKRRGGDHGQADIFDNSS